ncbi:urease accessory protein UreF [Thalassospira tepidiphila]|jgi:urease accessory protein|uniref:urease accessory protein UreF n=1 Tax=Thalassospira tepidiphila TaxID=393657 RepID=UPI0031403BC7
MMTTNTVIAINMDIRMTTDDLTLNPAGLMRLMTWLSPSFPVGAYTYSHGVEYAVEDGRVTSADSLINWVEGVLEFGAGRIDAVLFCAAWRAARAGDEAALFDIGVEADCWRGTSEMALEATAQGRAFVSTMQKVWGDGVITRWANGMREDDRLPSYPVAVGIAAAQSDVPLRDALTAYLHAMAANLVSSAVRLVPLGQTDGVRSLTSLDGAVTVAVDHAMKTDLADLGAAAPMVDWTSMKHETQYTRLFRS